MRVLFLLSVMLIAQACQGDQKPKAPISQASAIINPTPGNKVHGEVTFTPVQGGIRIVADIEGLPPGAHGFHIHEKADCTGDATGAGGHFNPANEIHGAPESNHRHAGDLGNLIADDNGHAHYERVDAVITLDGPHSIIGKGLIIHEKQDDYVTQPTGNAGARIGCGVIVP